MYRSGPPSAVSADVLRLTGAARRTYDQTSDTAWDLQLRVYLGDMVAPYGLALREDLLTDGAGHSYGEMAEPLMAELVSVAEPTDLLVLAFANHDLRPGRATAMYLSDLCPGAPMAFAVCDQGVAAGFTGLRLVQDCLRTGPMRRALLLVLEQSALHYQVDPDVVPARHVAVALRFDTAAGATGKFAAVTAVRQHPGVGRNQVAALLTRELAELTAGRTDVTVVLGNGLSAAADPSGTVVRAPAGQPCTGAWWELAGPRAGLVIAAEYEANLGYLSLCAVDSASEVWS